MSDVYDTPHASGRVVVVEDDPLQAESLAFILRQEGYIVDLAALRVQGGKVVDRFESLVNPGRSIVGHQIHGLSDGDVDKAPTAAEVLTKFTLAITSSGVSQRTISAGRRSIMPFHTLRASS